MFYLLLENGESLLLENGGQIILDDNPVDAVIYISGLDKTREVVADTIDIQNTLTRKRDLANFVVRTHSGDTYIPALGNEVIIYLETEKVFAGIIVEIESKPSAFGLVEHRVGCQDYTRLLDKRLVPDAFTGQTANEIIAYLQANYFPEGFTINNVDANVLISYIAFNYKSVAKCLEELANILNYDWYVDYDKDVHFFAKETVMSPFDLADDTGYFEYNTLIIRRDNSQVRNTIYVRGGEYLAAQTTYDILTNGTDIVYPSPYKLTDPSAHITGEVLSVGVDGYDSPDNYDVLYNFKEKIYKWKDADKPNANKTLKIGGKPNLPVFVKYQASQEIAAMASVESNPEFTSDGVYEYLIKDDSINTKEGARQRARAEVLAYATTLSEGEFRTTTHGLKAGQKIHINSVSRGIDEDFIINKVQFSQFGPNSFGYQVSLITTRTFDLIDILQRLLMQNTNDIVADQTESIDTVFNMNDEAEFSDEISSMTSSYGPYYYTDRAESRYASLVKGEFISDEEYPLDPDSVLSLSRERRIDYLSGTDVISLGTTTQQQISQSFVAGDWASSLAFWTQLLSGIGSPTGGIKFSIQADSAGSPSGSDLVSYSPSASFQTGSDFDSFAPLYQLTDGVTYWLVLDRLGTNSDVSYYRAYYNALGSYGTMKVYDGASWNTVAGNLRFAVDDASYAQLASTISLVYNASALLWRMKTGVVQYQQIFSHGTGSSSAQIELYATDRLRFESKTNNNYNNNNLLCGKNICDDEWHTFLLVFGASNMELYVDDPVTPTWSKGTALVEDTVNQTYNYIGVYGNRINGTYGRSFQGEIANVTPIQFEPDADTRRGVMSGARWGFSTWS